MYWLYLLPLLHHRQLGLLQVNVPMLQLQLLVLPGATHPGWLDNFPLECDACSTDLSVGAQTL